MENASKAIVIAGSILIAVALVSLGVYLFSSSRQVAIDTNKTIEIVSKNAKNNEILTYVGEKQKGSSIITLINSLVVSEKNNYMSVNVKLLGGSSVPAEKVDQSKIENSTNYKIEIEAYDDEGLITEISINKA